MPDAALALYAQHQRGAQWFLWIAALSIMNSLIALSGSSWSVIVGLGSAQIVDALAAMITEEATLAPALAPTIALLIAALLIRRFALWGWLSKRGHTWASVVGMALYALDGGIFVLAADCPGVGVHVFALWGLFRGVRARAAQAAEKPRRLSAVPHCSGAPACLLAPRCVVCGAQEVVAGLQSA